MLTNILSPSSTEIGVSTVRVRQRASWRRRSQIQIGAPGVLNASVAPSIVTTVKGVQSSIDAWVSYHLALGFVHLFVYFDDPVECSSIDLLARFPSSRVSPIPHDDRLRAAWRELPDSEHCLPRAFDAGNRVGSGLNLRQELNARHAMRLAHSRGLDWLLHIDGDELFYPGLSGDAQSHFSGLANAGVEVFCYINHEGVPETAHTEEPFSEVTLFKRNMDAVPRTATARAAGTFWTDRVDAHSYFLYYDNGKSAARVRPGVRPLSPHEWLPAPVTSGSPLACKASGTPAAVLPTFPHVFSNMTSRFPTCHVRPGNRAAAEALAGCVVHLPSDAAILHFPICGWQTLMRRWRLGNLTPSLWRLFHSLRAGREALSAAGQAYPVKTHTTVLHVSWLEELPARADSGRGQCEDGPVVRTEQGGRQRGQGGQTYQDAREEEARGILQQIYEQRVVLQDGIEARRQVDAGVCIRVHLPRDVLARHGFPRQKPPIAEPSHM